MTWQLVDLDRVPPQPWRNGGGTTRELLAWPTAGDWKVRISVADVTAAGPFSRFAGLERWFAVLEGAGVVLDVAGGKHWLRPDSAPFRFDGAVPVDCTLIDGPTRDFNLMASPGSAGLRHLRREEQAFTTRGAGLLAVYAHGKPARATLEGDAIDVPARHLAWCRHDGRASGVARGDGALLVEVHA